MLKLEYWGEEKKAAYITVIYTGGVVVMVSKAQNI